MKFNDTGTGIAVNGALVADGTATERIIFTSVRDQDLGTMYSTCKWQIANRGRLSRNGGLAGPENPLRRGV